MEEYISEIGCSGELSARLCKLFVTRGSEPSCPMRVPVLISPVDSSLDQDHCVELRRGWSGA